MFESLLYNHEVKLSCALHNLYLALLGWVNIPLAYLFNLCFTKTAWEWIQLPIQNTSTKILLKLSRSNKAQRFVPVIRTNSVGRKACYCPDYTMVSALLHSPCSQWCSGDSPQSLTSSPLAGSSFYTKAGVSSA